MGDLSATYDRLARRWTHEQLADRYQKAKRRGEQLPERDQDPLMRRPIAMLASAVPSCASLSVAIQVIHILPAMALELRNQLLRSAEDNSALALYRCHAAVELDGQAHGYSADEWLPAIYDVAAPLLEGARLSRESPSLVGQAQEAVRWLSRAILALDGDSPDAGAALVDGSGACLRCTSSRMLPTALGRSLIALVARAPRDPLSTRFLLGSFRRSAASAWVIATVATPLVRHYGSALRGVTVGGARTGPGSPSSPGRVLQPISSPLWPVAELEPAPRRRAPKIRC
jgi:hypothetical protein